MFVWGNPFFELHLSLSSNPVLSQPRTEYQKVNQKPCKSRGQANPSRPQTGHRHTDSRCTGDSWSDIRNFARVSAGFCWLSQASKPCVAFLLVLLENHKKGYPHNTRTFGACGRAYKKTCWLPVNHVPNEVDRLNRWQSAHIIHQLKKRISLKNLLPEEALPLHVVSCSRP